MWNKISQAAGLNPSDIDIKDKDETDISEEKQQLEQQKLVIQQLKDLLREHDKKFADKENELQETVTKFQKFKLQSKAKISHLSSQLKEQDKPKKDDCDFDDTSSSDSSDQGRRGKVLFFKKQLDQAKHQIESKEAEISNMCKRYEKRINDLETQLNEKNVLISAIADKSFQESNEQKIPDESLKKGELNISEMYAQIVYKDSKIMELNNQILEHEKKIMDLQENIREKDEVLLQRNRAVQLIAEDMNRKGMSVVNELDETRDEMKIMQENFAALECNWKTELDLLNKRIKKNEEESVEKEKQIKSYEEIRRHLESEQHQLSVKNAELQKKVVIAQENASKQCELYQKETEIELDSLRKELQAAKTQTLQLQKSLSELNSQSENKILKARVKERSKLKALEREMETLKKTTGERPQELTELQQRIAELEEEKGSLQLKLMETEELISMHDSVIKEHHVLEKTHSECAKMVENFEKQIHFLDSENCSWKRKHQTLSEEFDQLQQEFHHFSQKNNEKIKKLSSLENDHERLLKENSDVKTSLDEANRTLNELKEERVTLEFKVIELEEMRERDDKVKRELNTQLDMLKESFNEENHPKVQLKKEKEDLKLKLTEVVESVSHFKIQNEELARLVDALKTELEDSKREFSRTSTESERELGVLLNKFQEQEAEHLRMLDSLKESIAQERADELKSVQEQLSSLRTKCRGVCEVAAVEHIEDCVAKWADINADNARLSRECSEAKEKVAALLKYQEDKEKEMEEVSSFVNQLRCSQDEKEQQLIRMSLEQENSIKYLENEILRKEEAAQTMSRDLEQHTESLTELRNVNDSLSKKIVHLENLQRLENEKAQGKVTSLLSQIEDLESEVSHLREDAADKRKEVESLQNAISVLGEEKAGALEKEKITRVNLEVKVEEYKLSSDALKESLSTLQVENEKLVAANTVKDGELSALSGKLEKEMREISEKFLSAEMDVTMKNEQIRHLESQNATLQEQISHFNLSIPEKEEMYKKSLDEKLVLEAQLAERDREVLALTIELTSEKTESSSCKSTIERLETQIQEQQQSCCDLRAILSKVENENLEKEQRLYDYVNALNAIKNEHLDLDKKVIHLVSENGELKKKMDEQEENIIEFHKKYKDLEEKHYSAISSCYEHTENMKILENDIVSLKNYKAHSEARCSNLLTELNSLDEKNKSITESRDAVENDYLQQISNFKVETSRIHDELKSEIETLKKEKTELLRQCETHQQELADRDAVSQQTIHSKDQALSKLTEEVACYQNQLSKSIEAARISSEECSREITHLEEKLQVTESSSLSSSEELRKSLEASEHERQNLLNKCLEAASEKEILQLQIRELHEKVVGKEKEFEKIQSSLEEEYNTKVLSSNAENTRHLNDEYHTFMNCILGSFQDSTETLPFKVEFSDCEYLDEFLGQVQKNAESMATCILNCEFKIKNMNHEVIRRKKEVEELSDQYGAMQEHCKACQLENESLKSDCKRLGNIISNHIAAVLEAVESATGRLFSALQSKCEALSSLEANLLRCKNVLALRQNDLTSSQIQQEGLLTEIESLQHAVSEVQFKLQAAEKENIELVSLSKDETVQHLSLKESISLLESKHADDVKEISNRLADVSSEFLRLQLELDEKSNALIQEENKLKASKEINFDLKSDLKSVAKELENKNKEMQEQLTVYEGTCRNFDDQITGLNLRLKEKDEKILKLSQDHENNENSIVLLRMEVEKSQSAFKDLQTESSLWMKQRDEHLEQLTALETSHNVSDANWRRKLAQQKTSLQQQVEDLASQAQSSVVERRVLEDTVVELQHQLSDLREENSNLSNLFEELKLASQMKESEHQLLIEQNLQKCQRLTEELEAKTLESERLWNENVQSVSKTDYNVIESKLSLLKNNFNGLHCFLTDLKRTATNIIQGDPAHDLKAIESYNIVDDSVKQSMSEFQDIVSVMKDLKMANNELNNSLKITSSERNVLLEEVDKFKNCIKESNEKDCEVKATKSEKNIGITPVLEAGFKVEEMVLCHSSPDGKTETEFLKQELHSTKLRSAKMLAKLKLFKEKIEKLQSELNELKGKPKVDTINETNVELEKKILQVNESYTKLLQKSQFLDQQHQLEVVKLENILAQTKERNKIAEEEGMKVREELHQYKNSWNESMISFELQKEDNERLGTKLREKTEELKNVTAKSKDQEEKLVQSDGEIFHLLQQLQNMKDQSNMLLSDNETYQGLIEKLKFSKMATEQKLVEIKNTHEEELIAMKKQLQVEIDKLQEERERSTYGSDVASQLEERCSALKDQCSELQKSNEGFLKNIEDLQSEVKSLKHDKAFIQRQLLVKNNEIKILSESSSSPSHHVDKAIQGSPLHISRDPQDDKLSKIDASEANMHELIKENQTLKCRLNDLTQELRSLHSNLDFLTQQNIQKGNLYEEEIEKLHEQIRLSQASIAEGKTQASQGKENLESELHQAMNSLHRQGLRCEELSLEVSKLVEDRNALRWRLQQVQSSDSRKQLQNESSYGSEESSIPMLDEQSEIIKLQQQLSESTKTCLELRSINEALDQALLNEQIQKRTVEEELHRAKDQFSEVGVSPREEFRLLLGDFDEPEMLPQTDFAISRKMKSHTLQLQRWLRGRRNYLARLVKSRNYSQLVYLCYILILHVWLIACVFR